MGNVPSYVSITFILTTFAAIGFLLRAIRRAGLGTFPSGLLVFLLPLWIFLQAIASLGGIYSDSDSIPPLLFLLGVCPAIALIGVYFIFFRSSFIERLPLQTLTLVHIVRIPAEVVILWLFYAGFLPQMMTFEGRNFDIIAGLLSPVVYWISFRGEKLRRGVLFAYNVFGLLLLANVVSIAALSLPSPLQSLNVDQPNRAVLYFPYVWLPTIVVPIALFSHLASLWKLYRERMSPSV